jgi:polysaccharide export outer membrane protein
MPDREEPVRVEPAHAAADPSAPIRGREAVVAGSPAAAEERYVAPQYRIRTGDTLQISIPYETDSNRSVPVRPDGRINYLFDVEVMAAGKTYAELNGALCEMLARYYKNPQVTIIGKSFAGNAVYVMGPVGRPGRHEIQNDSRLLDILSVAGAMSLIPQTDEQGSSRTKDVVDLERAILIRGNRQLNVNFNDLLQGQNIAANNIHLQPRDFIYLPSSYSTNKRVYIVGAVSSAKVHYYSGELTFMGAVAEAEGVINGAAWVRRCYILRGGVKKPKQVIRVDYAALLKGRGEDLVLKSGDVVYVPKNPLFQINEVLTSVVQPLRTVIELDDMAKNQFREGHRMYKNMTKSRFWR